MAFRIHGGNQMRITLGAKLAATIAVCVSVALLALALVCLRQAQISADEKAESLALEASRTFASRVQQDLGDMLSAVSTTRQAVLALWSQGFRNRNEADALLQDLLTQRRDRFGAWTVWKPDAFDGRDRDFASTAHSDRSGRVLTYWRREGSNLVGGAVSGYGDPNAALYRDPLDRQISFLSEPYYVMTDDGDHTAVISYSEPIVADAKTLGAIGLDVALTEIVKHVDSIPRAAGSMMALMSSNGTVVATTRQALRDKSLLEQHDAMTSEFQQARVRLNTSKPLEIISDRSLRSWRKITFGSSDKPWYLLTDVPLKSFAVDTSQRQLPTIIAAVGLLFALLAAIFVVVRYVVSMPLRGIEQFIQSLGSEGAPVAVDLRRRDEIGSIARALGAFRASEQTVKQLQKADAQRELVYSQDRRAELGRLADDLASSVQTMAHIVSETSHTSMQKAKAMADVASVSVAKTKTILDASAAARSSVQDVNEAAAALGELIDAINVDLDQAGQLAADAADRAKTSSGVTVELSSRAARIGDIVQMISGIATRTNLLALNATIEAARAGDAGKGFAVVAQEVKALASQTSAATQDIAAQIEAMQRTASEAAKALTTIGQSVEAINGLSVQIASATQWQSEATARIGNSVETAVEASGRVTASLGEVDRASSRTGEVAATMVDEMSALSDASARLNDEVLKAVARIRAA